MKSLKSRFESWKQKTIWQKSGDIFFWALIILLIIPSTRKIIATGLNQAVLHVRKPVAESNEKQKYLTDEDYLFMISDSTMKVNTLGDFRGDVIFLNIWATWCPPCLAELPGIEKLYDEYGDKIRFLLVTNQTPEEVKPFIKEREIRAPVYYQRTRLTTSIETSSIPTTFIISKDGRIVARYSGAMDWNSPQTKKMLDELIAQDVLR